MGDPLGTRGTRRVYIWGGVLLLASTVWMAWSVATKYGALSDLQWALYDSGLLLVFETVGVLLPLVAALVFAFGSRDGGSVVAQRRLGIVAIAVFAVIPPLLFLIGQLRAAGADVGGGLTLVYLVAYVLQTAAGVVAVREIARAGVVPRSRLWLPIAAVGVAALAVVIMLLGFVTSGPSTLAFLLYGLRDFAPVTLALVFGVLALAGARSPSPTHA